MSGYDIDDATFNLIADQFFNTQETPEEISSQQIIDVNIPEISTTKDCEVRTLNLPSAPTECLITHHLPAARNPPLGPRIRVSSNKKTIMRPTEEYNQ